MEETKKKSKLPLIIGIVVAVVAIVAVIVGIVVFSSNKGKNEESKVNKEAQQAEPNPFQIDAVYFCLSGTSDPADYGITTEQYFERNPKEQEENLTDNDTIFLYVFASLHSLENGKKDVQIPSSYYDRSLPGNILLTKLYYDSYVCGSAYEANNLVKNRLSKHWSKYEDGKSLKTSDILFAGSNESRFIVSQFSIKYHFYKQAIEDNTEFNLVWQDAKNGFSHKTTFNGKDIEKKTTLTEIENSLKEKGLI